MNCSYCDKTFTTRQAKRKHERDRCPRIKLMDTVKDKASSFQCDYCFKSFETSSIKNRHQREACPVVRGDMNSEVYLKKAVKDRDDKREINEHVSLVSDLLKHCQLDTTEKLTQVSSAVACLHSIDDVSSICNENDNGIEIFISKKPMIEAIEQKREEQKIEDERVRRDVMSNLSYRVKCFVVEFKCDDVVSEVVVDASDAVDSFKRCRDTFVEDVVKKRRLV